MFLIALQAVASDIDKEEKAIKAGITRSELFFAALQEADESKKKKQVCFGVNMIE